MILLSLALSYTSLQQDLEQLTARHQALNSEVAESGRWYRKKVQFEARLIDDVRYVKPGIQRFAALRSFEDQRKEKLLVKAPAMPWQAPLSVGQKVSIKGVYLLPPASSFAKYLLRNNYAAYVLAEEVSTSESNEFSTEAGKLELLRRYGDSPAFEVIAAVILGARDQLSEQTKDLFQALGCSHLLVVSGFHIAVVYGLARGFCRLLLSAFPASFLLIRCALLSNLLASLAAVSYAFISGFALPVSRALIVLLFFVLGEFAGRRSARWRTILLSFLAIEFLWPGAAFEAGAQLTFAAIIGIAVFASAFSLAVQGPPLSRRLRAGFNFFLVGFGAWLCTAPFVAYWFAQFVPLAAILNFFVSLPFCLCFVFAGGLAVTASLIGLPGSEWFMEMVLVLAEKYLEILELFASFLEERGLGRVELEESLVEQGIWLWFSATILLLLIISLRSGRKSKILYFE